MVRDPTFRLLEILRICSCSRQVFPGLSRYYNVTSGQLTILLNTTVDPNTTPVYVPQHDRVVQVLGATNIT